MVRLPLLSSSTAGEVDAPAMPADNEARHIIKLMLDTTHTLSLLCAAESGVLAIEFAGSSMRGALSSLSSVVLS